MKKKIFLIIIMILIITGCSKKYPELEKNAIGFETNSYIDELDDNASYLTFEYEGRTYMPYSSLKGTIHKKDVAKCIGYIIQNENVSSIVDINNKDTRVYTLTIDPEHNFLMIYYIGTTLMNQPDFFRATDTKGKNIKIPEFIDDTDYNYWKRIPIKEKNDLSGDINEE